jgi:hypothetical protein
MPGHRERSIMGHQVPVPPTVTETPVLSVPARR